MEYNVSENKDEKMLKVYFRQIKQMFHNVPVVFLSKRIQMVYEILLSKYPEIKFDKYYSSEDNINFYERLKCVYLNDISYELINGINPKKYIPRLYIETDKYYELINLFNPGLRISKVTPPFLETNISVRKQEKINQTNNKQFRYCAVSDMEPVINLLETERRLLENSGVENVVELLPLPFQEYFRFCLENSGQLERFKEKYKETYERRKGDITIFEIQTIVDELVNEFGSSQVSRELVGLILETNPNSVWLQHEPIRKTENTTKTVGIQKVKQFN